MATLFPSAWDVCQVAPPMHYLEKARIILAEIWRKNIDAMNESERTRTMKGSLWKIAAMVGIGNDKSRAKEYDTYTLRPGESSVYNFSMVFDDPPAPAARDELGLTCDVAARRL